MIVCSTLDRNAVFSEHALRSGRFGLRLLLDALHHAESIEAETVVLGDRKHRDDQIVVRIGGVEFFRVNLERV